MTSYVRLIVADSSDASDVARPTALTLDECIAPIRDGDARAFEHVYHAVAGDLIEFGVGMLGDPASASDLVADIFVDLWERRATWHPSGGVRAYLFTAIRHRALNALRDARRHEQFHRAMVTEEGLPGMSMPPVAMDRSLALADEIETIFRTIGQFPETQRTVMLLHWRNELSVAEIAGVMEMTPNAVYLHLKRGLRALKQRLPRRSE